MSWYRLGADAVLVIHAGFVSFVLFGLIVIWVGIAAKWDWVRNRWFRAAHLAAIALVVIQSWFSIRCPLTVLEDSLRARGGELGYGPAGCIEYWLHRMIFFAAPPWVFIVAYTLFAAAVVGTMIMAPPRWRRAAEPASRIPDMPSTSA